MGLWLQYAEDVKAGKVKFHYGTINKRYVQLYDFPGIKEYNVCNFCCSRGKNDSLTFGKTKDKKSPTTSRMELDIIE